MSSPTSPATSDTVDVVDLLISDHRAVESLFNEIESLLTATDEGSLKRVKDLTEQVTIELVNRSVAEEAAVYPRIAERVHPEEAAQLRDEQAEAEATMKRLEKLQPEHQDFQTELHLLMAEIRGAVTEEEGDALPKLRNAFSHEELVEMTHNVTVVKAVAPTRPHPQPPDTPPGNLILGPVTGLFDRLPDSITHRGA